MREDDNQIFNVHRVRLEHLHKTNHHCDEDDFNPCTKVVMAAEVEALLAEKDAQIKRLDEENRQMKENLDGEFGPRGT